MIIDIHAHIWKGVYQQHKDMIIKSCVQFDITKVYVSGLNSEYPDENEICELNDEVYSFMREQPEVIGGFCYLNPTHTNCLDELKRRIEGHGMSGVKLWIATLCDDSRVFSIVEQCIRYQIPILVHAFHKAVGQLEHESTGVHVANLARQYPEATIIMAHLGANCYHGIKAIKNYRNVYVDTSGCLYRRDDIDYTVSQIGADRVLFGTDMPGARFLINYGRIEEAELTQGERDAIYYGNAKKLLGQKAKN